MNKIRAYTAGLLMLAAQKVHYGQVLATMESWRHLRNQVEYVNSTN